MCGREAANQRPSTPCRCSGTRRTYQRRETRESPSERASPFAEHTCHGDPAPDQGSHASSVRRHAGTQRSTRATKNDNACAYRPPHLIQSLSRVRCHHLSCQFRCRLHGSRPFHSARISVTDITDAHLHRWRFACSFITTVNVVASPLVFWRSVEADVLRKLRPDALQAWSRGSEHRGAGLQGTGSNGKMRKPSQSRQAVHGCRG